jgi:hypothetical protein
MLSLILVNYCRTKFETNLEKQKCGRPPIEVKSLLKRDFVLKSVQTSISIFKQKSLVVRLGKNRLKTVSKYLKIVKSFALP